MTGRHGPPGRERSGRPPDDRLANQTTDPASTQAESLSSIASAGDSAEDFNIPLSGNERHKGYAWNYSPRSGGQRSRFMDAAEAVIRRYAAQGRRVSTRACAYKTAANLGVGHEQLDNIEDAILMLRRTRRIEMDAVIDGRSEWVRYWTDSAAEAAEQLSDQIGELKADRQEGQPYRVVLLAEAAGMIPILADIADEFGVPVVSGSGSVPLSVVHTIAAEAVVPHRKTGVPMVVLCITDFDLMGLRNIFVPFARDVAAFARDFSRPEAVEVRRIAATPEQISANLPHNLLQPPPPVSWWPVDFSLPAAEALVDELPGIARSAFERYLPDSRQRRTIAESESRKRQDAARELAERLADEADEP